MAASFLRNVHHLCPAARLHKGRTGAGALTGWAASPSRCPYPQRQARFSRRLAMAAAIVPQTLGGGPAHRTAGAGGRHGDRGAGARRHRLGGRRGVLQYGHHRLSGDPDRPLLRRPDHHLHLPAHRQRRHQPRGYRDLQPGHALGRARLRAARRCHRAVQLSRRRASRRLAEGTRHHRHHRRRHAGADGAHPREGHAERRHRARAVGQVRPRQAEGRGQGLAGPAGARPGARGDGRPELHLGRDALGLGQGLRAAGGAGVPRRGRSTTASSATSCAAWRRPAAR